MRRIHRLRTKVLFRLLREEGRRIDSPFFRVSVRPNSLRHARLACVAPRTVDKRATVRNRLRRRAREWIRTKSSLLTKPLDLVVVFKREAARAPRRTFYAELARTMARIGH